MRTKNGVELDLTISEYKYKFHDLTFYFSSELYRKKFEEQLTNYINIENMKINNKYKITIDMSDYLAISFYKKIEKRGFLVYYNNENLENCYCYSSIEK